METYIALIQKRTEFGNRHWIMSTPDENKEQFIERIKNCYIRPYANTSNPYYYEVEIHNLGELITVL